MKKAIILSLTGFLLISCSTALKSITAEMPDLTQINDGVYRGMYDLSGTPVMVTLDVTVQDHKVINIGIIKHSGSPIGKRAEVIIKDVIDRQNLNVDVISGSTASSKSILKAIENALQ